MSKILLYRWHERFTVKHFIQSERKEAWWPYLIIEKFMLIVFEALKSDTRQSVREFNARVAITHKILTEN